MSPASTIAAGSSGVLQIAADNANQNTGNFPADITDSVGNSWHRWQWVTPGGISAAVELGTYVCTNLTTQLTSSDNVTITYTAANVTAKAWVFTEVTPATAGNVAIVAYSRTNNLNAQTAPSLATQDIVNIGNVVMAMCGAESGDTFTPDSDTTNGSWTTHQHTGTGSGATGMSITSQGKVQTTANSVQTYDPTLTSADISIGLLMLKEVAPATRSLATPFGNSATTFTITFYRPLALNSIGVMGMSVSNSGSNGSTKVAPSSLTDSAGNTWTQQLTAIYDPGAAGAGSELSIYTAPITSAISAGATVVVTWDGSVSLAAKAAVVYEFAPDSGKTIAYVTSAAGTTGNSATPTVTTGSLNSGDIVVGVLSPEEQDTSVADSDSTNGSWSTMQSGGSGTSTTVDQSISSQYKITTGAGTQTYNPTLSVADLVIGYAVVRQSSSQSATNGFFQY